MCCHLFCIVQWINAPQEPPSRAQTPRPNSADKYVSEQIQHIAKQLDMQTIDQYVHVIREMLQEERAALIEEVEWISTILESEIEYAAAYVCIVC